MIVAVIAVLYDRFNNLKEEEAKREREKANSIYLKKKIIRRVTNLSKWPGESQKLQRDLLLEEPKKRALSRP
jgi:phage regulator Rha-like protein